ncbi:hypothetical protein [Methylovirgula sp. HY1]|nr:hypothetical protein [Methylovirgula sp. HY1]QXX76128.1 hypothetical protein MHY1_02963 [Methylovirgula sp. HY1]
MTDNASGHFDAKQAVEYGELVDVAYKMYTTNQFKPPFPGFLMT